MKRRILCCCLLWLGWAAAAHAAGEWFALTDANGWWTSDLNHPAAKKLKELAGREKQELTSVAFTPDGDWVILYGGNGFWTSNADLPACKKLAELQKKHALKCVAFTPTGGWVVFYDQNGYDAQNIGDEAFKYVKKVADDGGTLRSIAFTPTNGWVLLFDAGGVYMENVPDDLGKLLRSAVDKHVPVQCAAFTTFGDWFVLVGDGWKSNVPDHPAAKRLAKLRREGKALKWVAFAPDDLAAARYVLDVKPSQRVKAVLTTDIAHPDATVEAWYLYAPKAPTLPAQQSVETTFAPKGKVVEELSPLKRPVFFTKITDGRKEVHAVLTIEATLNSRRLRPLATGQEAPDVKDLSAEEVKHYTRSSETMDLDAKAFREWMDGGGLTRKDGESDMAFAHRAFAYIKHHFTYEFPTKNDSASSVCKGGKSDCGGLSCLFTATMRANGVPARVLAGRWAESQKPGDKLGGEVYKQWHVKAEFFARGVGWVPVDTSGAVGDVGGPDFASFGNDPGDFIVMEVDQDITLDSHVSGKQNAFVMQGVFHWWGGSGADKNNRYEEKWTVEKEELPKEH